jgi:hypothetical protein
MWLIEFGRVVGWLNLRLIVWGGLNFKVDCLIECGWWSVEFRFGWLIG